jgi:hypothetical protein
VIAPLNDPVYFDIFYRWIQCVIFQSSFCAQRLLVHQRHQCASIAKTVIVAAVAAAVTQKQQIKYWIQNKLDFCGRQQTQSLAHDVYHHHYCCGHTLSRQYALFCSDRLLPVRTKPITQPLSLF